MGFLDNLPFGDNPLNFIAELPFKAFGSENPQWAKDTQNVVWNLASIAGPLMGAGGFGAGGMGGLNPSQMLSLVSTAGSLNDQFSGEGGGGKLPGTGSLIGSLGGGGQGQQDVTWEEDPALKRQREERERQQQLEEFLRRVTSAI